jgi:hypothetical protein
MSQPPRPSPASRFTIPFEIPAYWTPEQALAVVELLDDLHTLIWAHYDIRLVELIGAERAGQQIDINLSDRPRQSRSLTGRQRQLASKMQR